MMNKMTCLRFLILNFYYNFEDYNECIGQQNLNHLNQCTFVSINLIFYKNKIFLFEICLTSNILKYL